MAQMKNVLVTGVSGFLGSLLCEKLLKKGYHVTGIDREPPNFDFGSRFFKFCRIDLSMPAETWPADLFDGVMGIFHLAARVHIMNDTDSHALEEYRKINTYSTQCLAELAALKGVKRFIFMSTIKVNGEGKPNPYTSSDTPHPQDPYAISKWEAEQELNRISRENRLEIAILRAPLVYGPGVKANLFKLFKLVDLGIPLPLKNVKNQRSLIFSGNLIQALIQSMENQASSGYTFLVSDGHDLSTAELINEIASALGKSPRMFPFPESLLRFAGKITNKSNWIDRLLGTLSVDSMPIQKVLNWKPPYSITQGMKQTAEWYVGSNKNNDKTQ